VASPTRFLPSRSSDKLPFRKVKTRPTYRVSYMNRKNGLGLLMEFALTQRALAKGWGC
jgi:hypothetical protein